jgi:hypothetical protein
MAYRDDPEPLKAAEAALTRELRTLEKREGVLRAALDETRQQLRHKSLPLLTDVRVASPCSADWNKMVGDDRVRFCGKCEKKVFNLSAMSAAEAEGLLEEHGASLCARFYRRKDGTVMTTDCAVGVRRKRVGFAAAAALLAGVPLGLGLGVGRTTMGSIEPPSQPDPQVGQIMMGEVSVVDDTAKAPPAPKPEHARAKPTDSRPRPSAK